MNATTRPPRRLKVLVVDDERISRRLMRAALESEFDLLEAADGAEAVEAFKTFLPDVVLLDVDMPVLDGVAAARQIRELAQNRFVAIFVISSAEEQPTLIRALGAGADDFLPKPFNANVFMPKLAVFMRLRDQQERILAQNHALDAYQQETRADHAIAAQIFTRMSSRAAHDPGLRMMMSSLLGDFNGDAILSAVTPRGQLRLLLADVTGHGLMGALGTLPLGTTFYTSTESGLPLLETTQRINRELTLLMPTNLFSAGVFIELDRAAGEVTLINAGMPPVFVVSADGVREVTSTNVPLGIVQGMELNVVRLRVQPGDHVYAMSDGIVERKGPNGDLFGSERVRALLETVKPTEAFDALVAAVGAFSNDADDVTLLAVKV